MDGKKVATITVALVVIIFGIAYWLSNSRSPLEKERSQPSTSSELKEESAQKPSETSQTKTEQTASTNSLDDITDNITNDFSADQNALDNERDGEIIFADTEGDLLNDLNKSYDENEY